MITSIRFNGVGISAFASLLTGGTSAFPRSAVGFVHMLERKLKEKNLSLGSNRRVAIGVEHYRLHQGQKNHTSPKMALSKPWKSQSESANSVLDYEWKCNATICLVINSHDTSERGDAEKLREALSSIVPSLRFSNGSIFVKPEFVSVLHGNDSETLKKTIRAVKASRCSFISCRSDLIYAGDEFGSFANALALFDVDASSDASKEAAESLDSDGSDDGSSEKKQRKWARKQTGWIIPLERGYQAVSQPVIGRPAARRSTTPPYEVPSYVVTPVIGLGEYISSKKLLDDLNCPAFWSSKSDRSQGFFMFKASSFND